MDRAEEALWRYAFFRYIEARASRGRRRKRGKRRILPPG